MLDTPKITGWDMGEPGSDRTVISTPELQLRIDPEFKALCPPLTSDERALLEDKCKAEGIREAVLVWPQPDLKGVALVLDGHNRIEIALAHQISFEYDVVEGLKNREDAKRWVIEHQLGRRNLNPAQTSELRGKLYHEIKLGHGGDRRSKDRSKPLKPAAEVVSERAGVTPATVKRDARFTAAVEILTKDDPRNRDRILSPGRNQPRISRGAVIAMAQQPDQAMRKQMFETAQQSDRRKLTPAAYQARLSALLAHKGLLLTAPAQVAASIDAEERPILISQVEKLRNWLEVLSLELAQL